MVYGTSYIYIYVVQHVVDGMWYMVYCSFGFGVRGRGVEVWGCGFKVEICTLWAAARIPCIKPDGSVARILRNNLKDL